MRTEIYRSTAGILWWRDEGILHVRLAHGHETTAEELRDMAVAGGRFLNARRAPLLVDRTHSYSLSFAALRATVPTLSRSLTAIAYYAPGRAARHASELVAETFLKDVIEHIGFFDNEVRAVEWLQTFTAASGQRRQSVSPPRSLRNCPGDTANQRRNARPKLAGSS